MPVTVEISSRNQRNLRLDAVVASEPELGPSIPDGGHGWLVVFTSSIIYILFPSILASYGILVLAENIETTPGNPLTQTTITTHPISISAIIFTAAYNIFWGPSQFLVKNTNWPRLVGISSVCLTSAGPLILWIGTRTYSGGLTQGVSGCFSGLGAILGVTQSSQLISLYFRKRLRAVNGALQCSYALGHVIAPIFLGYVLIRHGTLPSLLIYHIVIVQVVWFVVATFKNPNYVIQREQTSNYELLQNENDRNLSEGFAFDAEESRHATVTPSAILKSWLFLATQQIVPLIFWVLFPSYLYFWVDQLKMQQTAYLTGAVGLGSVFVGGLTPLMPVNSLVGAVMCAVCASGLLVISDAGSEGFLLFGALLTAAGCVGLRDIQNEMLKKLLGVQKWRFLGYLYASVGGFVLVPLIYAPSYVNCFRIAAGIAGIASFSLMSNYIWKIFSSKCKK